VCLCGCENVPTLLNPDEREDFLQLTFFLIVNLSLNIYGRAEMLCKLEEVRREMESRLDSQRRHMVQKESQLKNVVEELKVTCSPSRVFNFSIFKVTTGLK